MRNLVILLLVLSTSVFAQDEEERSSNAVAQPNNGIARDSIIGWCSAYHILQGDLQAAHDVELLAMIPQRVYDSRESFLTWSKRSDHNAQLALESGKNACQTSKKYKK